MKRSWLAALSFAFLAAGSLLAQNGDFRPDSGVLNGRRYMNGYFGFSYRFPEGWTGGALQHASLGATQMYPLFSANPHAQGASDVRYVSINADFLPSNSTIKSAKDFLELAAQTQSAAFEPLHSDKRYVFAGKQFYRVDMKAKAVPGAPVFYQTQITTLLRNYAVTFSFMAANSDDMEELVRTMESLTFFEPGELPVQVQLAANPVPRAEEKPAAARTAPVQVASLAPTTGSANPGKAEPVTVNGEAMNSQSVPASPVAAPIATLAGRSQPAHASSAGRIAEVPAVGNSFVSSAPKVQIASPAPDSAGSMPTNMGAPAPATSKVAPSPAAQAASAVTVGPERSVRSVPESDQVKPNEAASEATVELAPAQAQVTTVSSALPDQIQPLVASPISTTSVAVRATAASVPPPSVRVPVSTAQATPVTASPDSATVAQKRPVSIPSSLAGPPSATLPARVSVVSDDASTRAVSNPTPPSTLIQATRAPSTDSGKTETAVAATVSTTQRSSAPAPAPSAPAAASAPTTVAELHAPQALGAAVSPESKVMPAAATVATITTPAPIGATGIPSRVQVTTAVLEANLTRKTLPVYPIVAKTFKVEGLVVVNVVVDRDGNVREAKAVTGPPLLLRGAEDAVRQWRFKPYTVDGTPVEMESQIPLNFRLAR